MWIRQRERGEYEAQGVWGSGLFCPPLPLMTLPTLPLYCSNYKAPTVLSAHPPTTRLPTPPTYTYTFLKGKTPNNIIPLHHGIATRAAWYVCLKKGRFSWKPQPPIQLLSLCGNGLGKTWRALQLEPNWTDKSGEQGPGSAPSPEDTGLHVWTPNRPLCALESPFLQPPSSLCMVWLSARGRLIGDSIT